MSGRSALLTLGTLLGLFFTLAFFFLGYSLLLSLSFGILGGWCSCCLLVWWQIEEEPNPPPQQPTDEPIKDSLSGVLARSKHPKKGKSSSHPTRAVSIWEWVFKTGRR